jgi:shikimate kinase
MDLEGIVLSLGGGTLHNEGLLERVGGSHLLFVLDAEWPTLATRIAGSARPLLADAEDLYRKRSSLYRSVGIDLDASLSVAALDDQVCLAWKEAA